LPEAEFFDKQSTSDNRMKATGLQNLIYKRFNAFTKHNIFHVTGQKVDASDLTFLEFELP
jgi:hypothetical protein